MSSNFESRLVNSFGDGHNHELIQYEELKALLERKAGIYSLKGVFLGNVMCGSSSLDSLLLTQYGMFIVEYKNYGVDEIRITGQKEFLGYRDDGTPWLDQSGMQVKVKGGSHSNPYEQAQANRGKVFEALNKCFNNSVRPHVGVIIIFNGQVKINGLERFSADDNTWLHIINSSKVEPLLAGLLGSSNRGLNKSQIEAFVEFMSANRDVSLSADYFTQAKRAFELGNYSDADAILSKCDPNRREVVILKLQVTTHLSNRSVFNSRMTRYLDSQDSEVRDYALRALADAYTYGKFGYPEDLDKVVECISRIKHPTYEEDILIEKNQRLKKAQAQSRENDWEIDHSRDELLSRYHNSGRIAKTILLAATVMILIGMLITPSFLGLIPIMSLFALLGVLYSSADISDEFNKNLDKWYLLKKPLDHFDKIVFRLVNIHDRVWDGPRLTKTIGIGLIYFAILIIPFGACIMMANKIGDWYAIYVSQYEAVRKLNTWIVDFLKFNPFDIFLGMSVFYFAISALAYLIGYCIHAVNGTIQIWSTDKMSNGICRKKEYYVALPTMDPKMKFNIPHSLYVLKQSFLYGGLMTVALIVVEVIRRILKHVL